MREILRQIGFYMLGAVSLLYVIFSKNFAEMRVQMAFLNFPIFIGEIFLFICFVLSFFTFDFRSIKGRQWVMVFYFVCVLLKALSGYSLWGPLAFRHAALFYYLIFIFFGFIFYKKVFLTTLLKILILSVIFTLCVTKYFYGYWVFTLWAAAFILIRSFSRKSLRRLFYTGLLLAVIFSYKDFILTSRTFTVGNIASLVFLIIASLYIARIKSSHKVVLAGMMFVLLVAFIFKFFTSNVAVKTISNIKMTIDVYKVIDAEIKDLSPYFIPQALKDIKLFNPEQSQVKESKMPEQSTSYVLARDRRLKAKRAKYLSNQTTNFASHGDKISQEKERALKQDYSKQDYLIDKIVNTENGESIAEKKVKIIAYGNSAFRLFVWRDMIFEFFQYRPLPILGFDFGKPFRSQSMEILNQASGEWERDGWIEPHSSYLNILYRMGILGVALIGFLIWQFCRTVKGFIAFKSLSGILLCSVLINWLVAANFLPILELPYNAIVIWALWGMTLGYLEELKNKGRSF